MNDSCRHVITISNVDIVFGKVKATRQALALLDKGMDRDAILASTNAVLGVAGANLTVNAGEICVLMGLSGSGKSTLLRAVNGLSRVTRGAVLLEYNGKVVDVAKCSSLVMKKIRQRHVAMVFQQVALFPWRTVRENVGFGLEIGSIPYSECRRVVDEKLELVGLSQWGDKLVGELSGGMQQRVGLSRALATNAEILLMDEPFSALDPLMRNKLQDALLELQAKLRKTILFVSHDLDEALKLGSHIAVMDGGKIVQDGTPEEIVVSPANGYVRDFVSRVNPLSVFTACKVMRGSNELKSTGDGWKWLEDGMVTSLKVDDNGFIVACKSHDRPVKHLLCDDSESRDWCTESRDVVFIVSAMSSLRFVLTLMQHNLASVAVVDDDHRFIGAVTVNDVMTAVLKR